MTASATNIASTVAAGSAAQGPAGGAAAGAKPKGGALAGFESLLASLFPNAPTTAVGKGAAGGARNAHGETTASAKSKAHDEGDADAGEQPTVDDAAAAALAASLSAAAAAAADTDGTAGDATAPAYGRDKGKGAPAAPALANANPNARLAGKAGIDGAADTAANSTDRANEDAAAKAKTEPPQGRQSIPHASDSALEHAAEQSAVQRAAPAPEPATEPTTTSGSAGGAPAASLAVRPEPAPQPPTSGRSGKGERGKAVAEAAAGRDLPSSKGVEKHGPPGGPGRLDDKPASGPVEAADQRPEDAKGETKAEAGTAEPYQPADVHSAAQGAPAPTHVAHAVRGSPETVANLAAQIAKKLEARSSRFDLELNPAGLGKVDVRLEIGAEGRMSAAMTFDNPQAAADLKARAADLQRALEQAGFDLSGGISFDVAGGNAQQRQAGQDQPQSGRGFRGDAFQAALDTAGEAADAALGSALRLRRGVTAGLDVRI